MRAAPWNNLFITALGVLVMLGVNLVGAKVRRQPRSLPIVFVVLAVFAVFICADPHPNIDTDLLAFQRLHRPSRRIHRQRCAHLLRLPRLQRHHLHWRRPAQPRAATSPARPTSHSGGSRALVYILIAIGVFGTLSVAEVIEYGETAIAEAARPTLGDAGFVIMAIVALLSTPTERPTRPSTPHQT